MSNWGGKRPGAGRPKREKRVQIWPTVRPETAAKLNRLAFNLLISTGEVLDRLIGRHKEPKNLVDVKTKLR